ncbi:MAG TPA: hypothetical protein VMF03_17790 [Steroidobacteraceae bacterium]|nr:hypothetical protein [Steroidobacteraceae bacterium]
MKYETRAMTAAPDFNREDAVAFALRALKQACVTPNHVERQLRERFQCSALQSRALLQAAQVRLRKWQRHYAEARR